MIITIKKKQALLFFLFSLLPFMAKADILQWLIIPEQSSLSFTATQNDAPVSGQFKTFKGDIFVDPKNYKASKIHIVVDITSLSASYAELVSTLLTSDWFDAKMFPKADFQATQFNQINDKTYEAIGTLTIRDKSAPVTLTFTAEESPQNTALVQGSTTIKRSAFGVGQGQWANTNEIKDEVKVDFKLVAKKK